jgi:myo-inositol-1(or 4)-monophosphatase
MEIKDFICNLTQEIQKIVKPHLGKIASRVASGEAIGGDTTFVIDDLAEESLEQSLRKEGNIAFYSEDKGLRTFGKPEFVLVVDPIDGTRPAAAGLESCCVSIAVAKYKSDPLMKDVFFGCVQEIKNDTLFTAERGKGVRIQKGREEIKPILSTEANLRNLFWCIGFRGRPARPLVAVLGDLIDISSVDGGLFDLGSACFSMARLITGQMDAYIDIGKRIMDDVPWVKEEFMRVGRGSILNNNPYDIAAATLIIQEANCLITDGYGNSIDNFPVLGSGPQYQFSTVGATNALLHKRLIDEIDRGVERLKQANPDTLK